MLEAGGSVVALLMADQHDSAAVDARKSADDRRIVAERAVSGERHEIVGDPGDIILEMRPVGMPRDLRLLPGSELGISVAKQLVRLCLELRNLCIYIDVVGAGRGFPQLPDPCLELGDRLFEF